MVPKPQALVTQPDHGFSSQPSASWMVQGTRMPFLLRDLASASPKLGMFTFNAGGHASDSWCLARDREARARVLPGPLCLCTSAWMESQLSFKSQLTWSHFCRDRPPALAVSFFPASLTLVTCTWRGWGLCGCRVSSPHTGARPSTCTTSLGPFTDPMG